MEVKKSFGADLKNKRGLLLEIGLVAALGLVVAAFMYTPQEYRVRQVVQIGTPVETVLVPVTREQPAEQPRKVTVNMISDVVQIIKNDSKIPVDIDYTIFNNDVQIDFAPKVDDEVIEDVDFIVAETMPSFQGGDLNAFRTWVMENVKFPQAALENGVQGRVTLSFVVDKDGRVTNIQVLQAPDRSLAEEAVRVLNKSPKWTPGKQRNQVVRVKYTLPVEFRVQN